MRERERKGERVRETESRRQREREREREREIVSYWVTQKLPQIYTANHATFPIRIRKITLQISGNFWVSQYIFLTCEKATKINREEEREKEN